MDDITDFSESVIILISSNAGLGRTGVIEGVWLGF